MVPHPKQLTPPHSPPAPCPPTHLLPGYPPPTQAEGSKSRGEISGSLSLTEKGGLGDAKELLRLRAEVRP